MGYNTTVVVMNDALEGIAKDPQFGRRLVDVISRQYGTQRPLDVSAHPTTGGIYCNAATVIEQHHADETRVVLVGGNYGTDAFGTWGWKHRDEPDRLRILKDWADSMGYTLRKKPAKAK